MNFVLTRKKNQNFKNFFKRELIFSYIMLSHNKYDVIVRDSL